MSADRRNTESAHEFRLEGVGLVLGGGLLLAALVGSFLFGRWVERKSHPGGVLEASGAGPLAGVIEAEPTEVDRGLTYFDDLSAGGQELEPERQIAAPVEPAVRQPADDRAAPRPAAKTVPPAAGGDYYVQVFAGRDRGAAEGLVERLQGAGYSVKVVTEAEGRNSLFKVRVGGYPSRERAVEIASLLKSSGFNGAWVTKP